MFFIDLTIVVVLANLTLPEAFVSNNFLVYVIISWSLIALNTEFYHVYRFTKALELFKIIIRQLSLVLLFDFSYLGFFNQMILPKNMFLYLFFLFVTITFEKYLVYFLLKKFRSVFGGNYRRVVIVGNGKRVDQLVNFFKLNTELGYKLCKVYDLKESKKDQLRESFNYISEHSVDEIYCATSNLSTSEINLLIDFADNNLKKLKFIPDHRDITAKSLKLDYYGYLPVISIRNIPLDKVENQIFKRVFDILFSLLIIVFILSWLTPIIAILIKIESKGPVFFRQKRNGLNYKEFYCFKFRSMRLNKFANIEQVTKNDPRITKIGKFIRKTSIDELPQFFNVLIGDMSIVGPRPHMVSHTEMYAKSVNKFMVRHFIKPGITGLAQINGYRGEVETSNDIINRVRYDIFYLENWSVLLDLKISIATFYNSIKGEEKAY